MRLFKGRNKKLFFEINPDRIDAGGNLDSISLVLVVPVAAFLRIRGLVYKKKLIKQQLIFPNRRGVVFRRFSAPDLCVSVRIDGRRFGGRPSSCGSAREKPLSGHAFRSQFCCEGQIDVLVSCRTHVARMPKPNALRVAPGTVVLRERQFDLAIMFRDKARFPRSRGSRGISRQRKIEAAVALFLPSDAWGASHQDGRGDEQPRGRKGCGLGHGGARRCRIDATGVRSRSSDLPRWASLFQ